MVVPTAEELAGYQYGHRPILISRAPVKPRLPLCLRSIP
jgi:hypothetical protein